MQPNPYSVSSRASWLNLYIIVGAHYGLIVLLYIFVAQQVLKMEPQGLNVLQLAILAVSFIAVPGVAFFVTKPKLNQDGQRVLPRFPDFQSKVLIMCSLAEINTLIGIFVGRGYQVYIGIGATVFLLTAFVVPTLIKMRPIYKLTEADSN